jgi:hypothetical protein
VVPESDLHRRVAENPIIDSLDFRTAPLRAPGPQRGIPFVNPSSLHIALP